MVLIRHYWDFRFQKYFPYLLSVWTCRYGIKQIHSNKLDVYSFFNLYVRKYFNLFPDIILPKRFQSLKRISSFYLIYWKIMHKLEWIIKLQCCNNQIYNDKKDKTKFRCFERRLNCIFNNTNQWRERCVVKYTVVVVYNPELYNEHTLEIIINFATRFIIIIQENSLF